VPQKPNLRGISTKPHQLPKVGTWVVEHTLQHYFFLRTPATSPRLASKLPSRGQKRPRAENEVPPPGLDQVHQFEGASQVSQKLSWILAMLIAGIRGTDTDESLTGQQASTSHSRQGETTHYHTVKQAFESKLVWR